MSATFHCQAGPLTACGRPVDGLNGEHGIRQTGINCPECYKAMFDSGKSAKSLNDRMATMLRRLEWAGGLPLGDEVDPCCPVCSGQKDEGHSSRCDLATLLRELP